MLAKTLMVQGTASSVGKSTLVTAFCRIFRQDGWDVAPFKAQNMSLNSFVTGDGGEMGRAQVTQAEAVCVEPTVEMNPILLKPEGDRRSQVVVLGKPLAALEAVDYFARKAQLWPVVTASLDNLSARYQALVIEGAGSPAEVNLREWDIVNMRVARYCGAPVLLVADIDRGGVFAAIVGTLELLEPEERALVKAVVINKFRGDLSLLTPGIDWLEERTGIPVAGVIPYYRDIQIPEEDSVPLERRQRMKARQDYLLDIAVIALPHISNFDDCDPLDQEEGVRLRYVESGDNLGAPDLMVLPGTKTTIADLEHLRRTGLADELVALANTGTPVIGICGGYQMLGERLLDPEGIESRQPEALGLGLLPVTTTFSRVKLTRQVAGRVIERSGLLRRAEGLGLRGYEIHMGQSVSADAPTPFVIERSSGVLCHEEEGSTANGGNVLGTYVHGLFHNHDFRRALLTELASRKGLTLKLTHSVVSKEEEYDKLADHIRANLDMDLIYRVAGLGAGSVG